MASQWFLMLVELLDLFTSFSLLVTGRRNVFGQTRSKQQTTHDSFQRFNLGSLGVSLLLPQWRGEFEHYSCWITWIMHNGVDLNRAALSRGLAGETRPAYVNVVSHSCLKLFYGWIYKRGFFSHVDRSTRTGPITTWQNRDTSGWLKTCSRMWATACCWQRSYRLSVSNSLSPKQT